MYSTMLNDVESVPPTEGINPLSSDSDENEISPFIITTCSNIQVMRIREAISKDEMC